MKINKNIKLLSCKMYENKVEYCFCVITTFVWGLIAHAYGFFGSNFSHDSMNAFFAGDIENTVKIESGRFFVPLYRTIVRNRNPQPWLIGILGLFFLSIAVFFVIKLFSVKQKKIAVLIIGVMVTNISVIAQIASYIHEFDFNMLSLLFSVLAAYIWNKKPSLKWLATGVLLLFLSMGIYQSYLSVAITLIMIVSIMALMTGEDIKATVQKGLKGVGMILCACVVYYVFSTIVYAVGDFSQQARTDVFDFSEISNVPLFYLKMFFELYLHFASCFVDFKVYELYLIVPLAALTILTVVFVIFYSLSVKKGKDRFIRGLLIFVLGVLLPVGMDVTYILARGNGVHDLMTYAIWFTYVLLLLVVRWFASKEAPSFKFARLVKAVGMVLAFVFVWQNIVLANSAYLKKDIEAKSTLSLMTRVVSQMEMRDDYEMGETPVAFIGVSDTYVTIDGFEKTKNITGMGMKAPISMDTYKWSCNQYKAYFKYVLNYPINMCDDELHNALKDSEEVVNMPSFPNKDSMKMIDGVLVVKIGEYWFSKDD